MQEFQSIPGLAGRLFGGAAAAGLRRAQAQQQQGPGARCGGGGGGVSPEAAVKCPRCESTNTKFCYYNNYNLSQPRHFCKGCRRYWTKGGVLRNVPVGGGCRKAKRSSSSSASASPSPSPASSSAPSTPTSGSGDAKNPRRASASSPRSSSGCASPTPAAASTPTPTPTTATPSSSSVAFTSSSHPSNPFSTVDVAPPAPIFDDQAAALASLFAPPPPPFTVFSFAAAQPKEEASSTPSELELQIAGQAAPSSVSEDMAPFASLDAAGMFELGDASAAAYWNAGSCWTDVPDPSMYLLP